MRIKVLCFIIFGAFTILSFTFVEIKEKSNSAPNTTAHKKEANEPIGGFIIEDKL